MVLRRYTPPTCTLKITAQASPLSRWASKPVFKSLEFELHLDDPRLPEEQHVILRGDRAQLDALHEAVSNYVQDFLCQSPSLNQWQNSEPEAVLSPIEPSLPVSNIEVVDEEIEILDEGHNPFDPATHPPHLEAPASHQAQPISIARPHLQPRGLLSHDLFLGGLSGDRPEPVVRLSILQLFDLATALDEYATDIMVLPNLNRSRSSRLNPAWLQTAAVVLVTVGLTAGVVKLLDRSQVQQTATITGVASPNPAGGQLQQVPPPPTAIPGAPTTLPTPASLPPIIPPPPPTALPPSASSPPPSLSKTATPPVVPSPIRPATPIFPRPAAAPPPPERVVTIPGHSADAPMASQPAIEPRPEPQTLSRNPVSTVPSAPLPPPGISASRIPPTIPPTGELPPLQDAAPKARPEESQSTAASSNNRTLFDTIPQVSEARNYFEENWKPPEGLNETLEYSLQLDANGAIQRIIPLGQAAGDFIDRTNMPLVGEPFVSAIADGKNPRIRVVLRPNGKVQTFLEALN